MKNFESRDFLTGKSAVQIDKVEGARESAHLRQVNVYRRLLFEKCLSGHVQTIPRNFKHGCQIWSP